MDEKCDKCGEILSIEKGEDFFIETKNGSLVLCEKHWIEYEEK
ncbi:hypothetical protein NST02_23420 [Robertmurraya sp. FSL W8-0741]